MTTSNPPPLEQALRLLRLMPRLHRWAVTTVQANPWGQGLSMRQLGVLSAVSKGVSSPGLLARRLLVTPAVITGLVDRLERQGYIRREAEAGDRRRLCLALTKSGWEICDALQQKLGTELAAQLNGAPQQVKVLDEALEQVERALGILETRTRSLFLAENEDPDVPEPTAARARTSRASAYKRPARKSSSKKSVRPSP